MSYSKLDNLVPSVCKNNIEELSKICDDKQKNVLTGANFTLPYFFIF